jgi:hypothetical protein
MSDGPVLKQTIGYVGSDLLTRERLISAQKEKSHYLVYSIDVYFLFDRYLNGNKITSIKSDMFNNLTNLIEL